MAAAYQGTVNQLILSAARRGNIPDAQMTYMIPDFLAIANEELLAYALPVLHARREDYYLAELMFSLASPDLYIGSESPSTVKNPAWRLPEWAMASSVRDVQGVSPSGAFYLVPRLEVDDIPANSTAQGWFFYGDYIVYQQNLIGSVAPPQTLRVICHTKPNSLMVDGELLSLYTDAPIDQTQQAQITNVIDTTHFAVSIPVTYVAGDTIDICSGKPGYEVKTRQASIADVTAGINIELSSAPHYPYAVGDWITYPGFTPVVPLPLEMHALLAQRIVVKFLEAQGEESQLAQARGSLDEMVRQVPILIQPRAEGKPKKLTNRYGLWRRWRW